MPKSRLGIVEIVGMTKRNVMHASQRPKIPRSQGVTLPDDPRRAASGLASTIGERATLERLQISRQTLARVSGFLPVRVGTLAQVRQAIESTTHCEGNGHAA